jgi:osmotically-inducible protein OsmY
MHIFSKTRLAKLAVIGSLSYLLTACLPVMLVGAGAGAGTMLGRDSRSLQTISDDSDIQYQVQQAINRDEALKKQANISDISFNHIVLLVGQAPSEAMRRQAESLAQQVPKVRRVYNQIQVAPNIGAIQLADDATVSTNIKARLAVTSNINSNDFKYTVENKVVYLMGLSDKAQLQRVTDVIRNSSGVKKLVTLVEIDKGDGDNTSNNTSHPSTPPATSNDPTPVTNSADTTTPATPSTSSEATTGGAGNSDVSFQPVKSS